MRSIKVFILLLVLPLMSFSVLHKYYVSVTEIEYVKDKQSVQIISRYFIDDFEKLLRERYDTTITLKIPNEKDIVDDYIEHYLDAKLKLTINGVPVSFTFIGKEYDNDLMLCYLEVSGVSEIKSISVTNTALQDLFPNQQNVVKLKVNSRNKSFLLNKENPKGLLKF